ncbi:MAG TPA: trypsin-like serine protease [Usitatibacter sp.]|nr:trypsin-like serine protease [Usitatibacter sp.]
MPIARLLAAAAIAFSFPASALVVRADRDDAEYVELATRYVSALPLGSYGEGALIAPRWILTSGDVARALREAKGTPRLRIGEAQRDVQGIFTPPEGDIALLLLRESIDGIEPTLPYREGDEERHAVVIASHGAAGRLGEPGVARDGKPRAAINTVDRVEAHVLGLRLKGPDDASDMQGAAGPGDEGAPAFLEKQGRLYVAGIAQGPRGGAVPRVGDWDLYTRVSAYADWIDEAMFRAAADEARNDASSPRKDASSPRRRGSGSRQVP